MSSQPTRPFQEARELLKQRLATAAYGAADQVGRLAFTYRVSGGPPGKRLLVVLRVSTDGSITYEHQDELAGQRPTRAKSTIPEKEINSLVLLAHESGILDLKERGGGFLPDSTIASIGIESDDAQVMYHFPAEQQQSQGKEPPPRVRELKLKLEELCARFRDAAVLESAPTEKKAR